MTHRPGASARAVRWLLALAIGSLLGPSATANDPPIVAAAADLRYALTEVASEFDRTSGKRVTLSFGSSGNFATQIRNGAPFQLFLSADETYVEQLASAGFTLGKGTLYGLGRIVVIAPHNSPLVVDGELRGLRSLLRAGKLTRFAIANPQHAPYGARAAEALRHAGLWDALRPRLVYGENVAQAAQYATTGSAQGGIIALSLALSPEVSRLGRYAVVPASWHRPLRQRMVLLKGAGTTARAFYEFLRSPAARRTMRRFGFTLPQEHS